MTEPGSPMLSGDSAEPASEPSQSGAKGAFAKVLAALSSPVAKFVFVAIALAGAVWAVASQWSEIVEAISQLSWWTVVAGLLMATLFVFVTMLSWRAILVDMGSRLTLKDASKLFFVSQLGKYVPGGVWNYLAVVQMGTAHRIPRARSLSAMVISVMVSLVTAAIFAIPGLVFSGGFPVAQAAWLFVLVPVVIVMLLPPVLNRLVAFALKVTKRPPLAGELSAKGIGTSAGWGIVSWPLAGLIVWWICVDLGMDANLSTYLLAAGGYSLSWAVGFLIFFMPAGLGARELVLAAMLAGSLEPGAVIVVVLMARVLSTLGDIVLGVCSLAISTPTRGEKVADDSPVSE